MFITTIHCDICGVDLTKNSYLTLILGEIEGSPLGKLKQLHICSNCEETKKIQELTSKLENQFKLIKKFV